jgi:pyruvate decarboxylase
MAALITTFGVGELSAVNAIGGAYSEFVPIIHIVGQPSIASQQNGMLLHHTLGNGDFNVFANMSTSISCEVARLNSPREATTLIDHAIRECWIRSRPVYIALPMDVVQKKVEGELLNVPLDLSYPPNDPEKEDYVVDVVLKYLHAAKNPIILVDACAIRHRVIDEIHDLMRSSGLPTFVAPMGKGAIDETLPNYGGVYAGDASHEGVREQVESSDLVLSIGAIKSDFNTAGFTYRVSQLHTIDFHSTFVRVRYSEYPNIHMQGVLRKVAKRLGKVNARPPPSLSSVVPDTPVDALVTHEWLWPAVGQWLRENDIVITETGTSNFGIWETKFPKGVTALSQVLWGSIGYALGACQGAALAAKEMGNRRTILFIGDGSFQLTAQELSTMLKVGLKPIMYGWPFLCSRGPYLSTRKIGVLTRNL